MLSEHTAQKWFTMILNMIDDARMRGHKPTKIVIPLHIQTSISYSLFPLRSPSGVTTFYGYPVEDGPEIAVKCEGE